MIRLLTGTLCVLLLGTATVLGQVTYNGNGNGGFGDPIGSSSLEFSDDGTTVTVNFTKGSGDFNDTFVIYIDNGTNGRSSIGTDVNDRGDQNRAGISYIEASKSKSLTFPSGFEATHAISITTSFGGLWEIPSSGTLSDNGLTYVDAVGNPSSNTSSTFSFSFDFSEIGITSDAKSFKFVATYLNPYGGTDNHGYVSNEGYGEGFPGTNVEQADLTLTGYEEYHSFNLVGSEGWRIFSTPTSDNTYDDLLGNLWTQGITTGADVTNGDANVKTYNGSSFATVNDLTATMSPGVGFITYIYSDDDYDGNAEGFPKTLSLSGTENTGSVSPTLTSGADAWTLVGNPYASTIDWDELSKTELTGTVYVYDHSYGTPTDSEDDVAASGSAGSYRVWNGSTGSLTDGLIAPFQGFWVQNSASATSEALTIEEADQTTGGTFYKASEQQVSIKLRGVMNNMMSEAFLSFTENGKIAKDNFDGLKLSPLDFRPYLSVASVTGGTKLDINNLPVSFEGELAIPVSVQGYTTDTEHGTWIEMGGEVTLSWPALTNIPEAWGMTLTDLETGVSVDMKNSESYSFEIINSGKSKAGPSMTILNPQPPQAERMAKGNETPRFTITVIANTTTSTEPADTPEGFALEQNYPNPFNPTTSIQYSVGKSGEVELAIYNVMGRQVETLVSGTKSAGTYRASWDASGMASGIYYYRLQSAGQVLTRQMTLIK